MIEPFVEKQKRDGVISYGLSSYGYDSRCAPDFKIFTNVDNAMVDPKNFDNQSFVDRNTDVCVIPPNSFVLTHTVEYFRIPKDVLVICLGKSTYARCGLIVNVTPLEPGMGRACDAGDFNTTPLPAKVYANEGIAQFLFLKGVALVKQVTPTDQANTWDNVESLFPGSNVDQNAAQETAAKSSANLDKIVIQGGQELHGKIAVSGAKNAALKFMCAALLTDKSVYLDNMPNSLRDINSQIALLKHLGCAVQQNANMMAMNAKSICTYEAPYDLVRKMRASILVLGPLLARFGEARVSLPGGCAIGTRAVDMHLDGLKAMGAEIELVDGYINAHVPENRLRAADIVFPKVSVGATENMMMAACLAEGTTTLTNAAREPEIVDLGECLIKMGARIEGLGTQVLKITGVEALVGAHHSVLPDRIEAGTYMIAAAMTGGCVRMQNVRADHLHVLIAALRKMGVSIEERAPT